MPLLKTKIVSKCICGKDPNLKITRTDKNQALAIMAAIIAISAPILLAISMAQSSLGEDIGGAGGILFIGLYAFFLLVFLASVTVNFRKGHSLRCSLRQAFHRIT